MISTMGCPPRPPAARHRQLLVISGAVIAGSAAAIAVTLDRLVPDGISLSPMTCALLGVTLTLVIGRLGASQTATRRGTMARRCFVAGPIIGAGFRFIIDVVEGLFTELEPNYLVTAEHPVSLVLGLFAGMVCALVAFPVLLRAGALRARGAIDGPARLAYLGGLGMSLCGEVALVATVWSRANWAWVLPAAVTVIGLVFVVVGIWRRRQLERWFERVLEGAEPQWDIQSLNGTRADLDVLPPLFHDGDLGMAVLVHRALGENAEEECTAWARVPWTVPSRMSRPPADPSAKGPPVTEDIWKPK